jgi:hypothetical protein
MGAAVRCGAVAGRVLVGSRVDQPGKLVAQPGRRRDRQAAAAAAGGDRALSQPGDRPGQTGGAGPKGPRRDHPGPGRRPGARGVSVRLGTINGPVLACRVARPVRPGHHAPAAACLHGGRPCSCDRWVSCCDQRTCPFDKRTCPSGGWTRSRARRIDARRQRVPACRQCSTHTEWPATRAIARAASSGAEHAVGATRRRRAADPGGNRGIGTRGSAWWAFARSAA